MAKRSSVLLVLALAFQAASARQDLPVLRANSPIADIQDGGRIFKREWTIDPSIALDVYDARRSGLPKRVTFITDVDSMSFDVQPGCVYDFAILLNGTHRCPTRLSTLARSYARLGSFPPGRPDTIPVTIDRGKLHLRGTVNDSQTLDLIFDTGADMCVLYPSALKKGAKLDFDGSISNAGTGGKTLRHLGRENRLEIAGLRWEHEPVMYIEKQADAADGIVGYRVFEDKVIELDYDRMVMVVHEAVPAHAADYAKTPMPLAGSLTAVDVALAGGERSAIGPFLLDTGGTGTMMVNQAFATAHGLRDTLTRLGTSESRGVGSGVVRNDVLLLPRLTLAGFALPNVPINVESATQGDHPPPGGALCMEVLQRFNTILDYPRNEAYFKPNTLFNAPFKSRSSGPPVAVMIGVAAALAASVGGVVVLFRRKRGTTA